MSRNDWMENVYCDFRCCLLFFRFPHQNIITRIRSEYTVNGGYLLSVGFDYFSYMIKGSITKIQKIA